MNSRKVTTLTDLNFGVAKITAHTKWSADLKPHPIYCEIIQPSCGGTEEVCPAGSVSINGYDNIVALRDALTAAILVAETFTPANV